VAAGALAALLTVAGAAGASTSEKVGTFNGVTVHYKIVLPNGYDGSREYPVILTFPPGGQDMRLVDNRLQANWRSEAEHRGYVVISPAAPDGQLFFEQGSRVFPAFIDQILKDFKVRDGKLIVTGASNGGLSAFFVATHYPKYARVVIGYPGLLPESGAKDVDALKGMCVFMHVGGEDAGWKDEMQAQSRLLERSGVNVKFSIEPGQQHMIQTLSGDGAKRLFDEIESCK
jgi:predicted esterase